MIPCTQNYDNSSEMNRKMRNAYKYDNQEKTQKYETYICGEIEEFVVLACMVQVRLTTHGDVCETLLH